jgi:Zn-finger nucleic acid-binding protein
MSTPCLRCRQPLEEQQVDTIQSRFCRACKSMLLRHSDMAQLLEQGWRFVPENKARLLDFRATDALKQEATFVCPDCGQPMEKYGYMGFSAIPIDRCDRCSLVWLDSDDLQNMVLALAKSQYRSRDARAEEKESFDLIDLGIHSMATPARGRWLYEERPTTGAQDNPEAQQIVAIAQTLLSVLFRV